MRKPLLFGGFIAAFTCVYPPALVRQSVSPVSSHAKQSKWSVVGLPLEVGHHRRVDQIVVPSFAYHLTHLLHGLNERIEKRRLDRQAMRTEALTVGSEPFVEAMNHRIDHQQVFETLTDGGVWVLQEDYGPVFRPKK